MTNGTVWHQRDNTSSLFNNIKVPISKRVSEHWSKCHQSQSRRETEVNFYSTLVILVTLARCGSWHPQGQYVPRNNRHTLLFRQTGLDIFYSNPKQLLLQHATFHSPRPICDWRVFVSSPLSPGVCLPDTCLAWPSFALISSVTARTCEGHLSVLLCESLPTLCLCQQLGTDACPRSPNSRTYWATAAHLPWADSLICMSINHSWNWWRARQGKTLSHKTHRAKLQCDSPWY